MKDFYYYYWSRLIISFKENHPNETVWEWKLIVFVSTLNAINLWLILSWLQYFDIISFEKYALKIFATDYVNNIFNYLILFIIPFYGINYMLIFRNDRYLSIIEKYKDKENQAALVYSYGTIFLGFISLIVQVTF